MIGKSPMFANGGHGGEIVLGIIGIVVVLVWGYIWRTRKLRACHAFRDRGVALEKT